MSGDCLFCKIAKKEIPAKLVHEDESVVAFRDINPQAPTHILITPRRHLAQVSEAKGSDFGLFESLHRIAAALAKKEGLTDYRLVINNGPSAGQSVFHIHLHLLGGRPFAWPPG